MLLSAYDYELVYRPGAENGNADGLSRLPLEAKAEEVSESFVPVHMMELVNSPVSEKEVAVETRKDPVLAVVLDSVLTGWSTVDSNEDYKPFLIRKEEITSVGGCVLWGNRVVIPKSLQGRVLEELHEVHLGASKMKALARSFVWWPGMDKDIELKTQNCTLCRNHQSIPSGAPMHSWQYPSSPWERIHVDYAGPFMGRMFFILVDAYSKWLEVVALNNSTSETTVKCLRKVFAVHGLPQVLVSDNGSAFIGSDLEIFLKKNGIRHIRSAPYHPKANGQAERMVRVFKESMKCLAEGDVETKLARLLFKYRITPHTSTGRSPAELLFNRQLRSPLHLLKPSLHQRMKSHQYDAEIQTKCKSPLREFGPGDLVRIRNFGRGDRWFCGTIFRRTGAVDYEVLVGKDLHHRHIDQIQKRTDVMVPIDGEGDGRIEDEDTSSVVSISAEDDAAEDHSSTVLDSPIIESDPVTLRRSSRLRNSPERFQSTM